MGDGCVASLRGLTRLETLSLSGNRITDKGLAKIAELHPALEDLDLDATDVTDAGLASLAVTEEAQVGQPRRDAGDARRGQDTPGGHAGPRDQLHIDPEVEQASQRMEEPEAMSTEMPRIDADGSTRRDGPPEPGFSIRPARPEDSATIANLVRELAVYEKLEQFAQATADDFRRHLFGPRPYAEAILAEVDGEPVGFALAFPTFSTFRGQPGLYLEDIFVRPEHRGRGIGKALLASVARLAPGARLRPAGMVGAQLERAGDWLLPRPGGPADGRVDGLPDRRRAARPARRAGPGTSDLRDR